MTGIISELFFNCIGNAYKGQGEFLQSLFWWVDGLTMPAPINGFIHYDYVPNASDKNLEKYSQFLVDKDNKKEIMCKIRNVLPNGIFDKELNMKIINIASSVTRYGRVRNADERKESDFVAYDADERKRLITYLTITSDNFNLAYNIYLLISLAVSKRLPNDFTFGTHFEDYLKQFNEEVTCMHGVTTFPGIARIIALAEAESPNPFCILSYADLLYYGQQYGVRKNLAKCYKYYRIAAGLEGIEKNDATRSFCHPLALFSAAFLLKKYKDTDAANTEEYVEDIQKLSITERYAEAAKCAAAAFILAKIPAAANTLGQIAGLSEEDAPGIEKIKKRYQLQPADYYFNFAAEAGYVYATNNLAMKHFRLAFQERENSREHLNEYIRQLRKSAEQYDPWALNRLGEIYRMGEFEKRVGDEKEILSFKDIVDRRKAYNFYLQAIEKFSNFDSAWPYAHLIIDYPEKFREDKAKLKRYLEISLSLDNSKAADYIRKNFKETYKEDLSKYVGKEL